MRSVRQRLLFVVGVVAVLVAGFFAARWWSFWMARQGVRSCVAQGFEVGVCEREYFLWDAVWSDRFVQFGLVPVFLELLVLMGSALLLLAVAGVVDWVRGE